MEYKINKNSKFNSLEVSFDSKPDQETIKNLKSINFRWNPKRGIWYGFAEIEKVEKALNGAAVVVTSDKVNKTSSLWERCNIDGIPEHDRRLDTKTIAAETRKHIKSRFPEIKFSCRIGKGGWAAANEVIFEFVSGPYAKDSEAFEGIEDYVKAWLWSFNYDESDAMTDYFERNFYEEIESYSYKSTEPTAEQLADIEDFNKSLEEAIAKKEEEAHQKYLEYLQEQEEKEKLFAERRAREEEQQKEVIENVEVVELPESDKYLLSASMICGYGKECNVTEIEEDGTKKTEKAIIKRELHFSSEEIYSNFCNLLLYDFDFLAGCGGTGTLDKRVDDDNVGNLNKNQRNAVDWILWDCVAVYLGEDLKLVIDPEGYSYARYTNIIVDDVLKTMLKDAEEQEESTAREDFYIPAKVSEQSQDLKIGNKYSLIYLDPWSLCATMHHITLTNKSIQDYAQYHDSLYIEYLEQGKRKSKGLFVNDGDKALLYDGFIEAIPEELRKRQISSNMFQLINCGETAEKFMIDVFKHYKSEGINPIVNTLQF